MLKEILKNSPLAKIEPKTQLSEWAIQKVTKGAYGTVEKCIQNSNVLRKLISFSNILTKRTVHIYDNNLIKVFTFPVPPAEIDIDGNNIILEEVDTIKGKINYKKDISFTEISFKGFFPAQYYNFNENNTFANDCVEIINRLKNEEKPVKLVITGVGIVLTSYIEDFSYSITENEDIEYKISFKESKDPSIIESESKSYVFKPNGFDLSK